MNGIKLLLLRSLDFILITLTVLSFIMVLWVVFLSNSQYRTMEIILGSTNVIYILMFGLPFAATTLGIYLLIRTSSFNKRIVYMSITGINFFILSLFLLFGSIIYFFSRLFAWAKTFPTKNPARSRDSRKLTFYFELFHYIHIFEILTSFLSCHSWLDQESRCFSGSRIKSGMTELGSWLQTPDSWY